MPVYNMSVERIETYHFPVEAEDYATAEEYAREMVNEFGDGADTVDYWIAGFEEDNGKE